MFRNSKAACSIVALALSCPPMVSRLSAGQVSQKTGSGSATPTPEKKEAQSTEDTRIVLDPQSNEEIKTYLNQAKALINTRWLLLVPEEARGPLRIRGMVAVSFAIEQDGAISQVEIASQSGDDALDKAALRAVLDSNPLPPLPGSFVEKLIDKGKPPRLRLYMHFQYNPEKSTASSTPAGRPTPARSAGK